jgi:acyl-coenzyme A thioesterase PaaI-like protein
MVRPVTAEIEKVCAEGEVLYRGRRQATAQAKLTDAATGKLLAHGTATCLIL